MNMKVSGGDSFGNMPLFGGMNSPIKITININSGDKNDIQDPGGPNALSGADTSDIQDAPPPYQESPSSASSLDGAGSSGGGSFLSKLEEMLMQFLEQLLKKLGIDFGDDSDTGGDIGGGGEAPPPYTPEAGGGGGGGDIGGGGEAPPPYSPTPQAGQPTPTAGGQQPGSVEGTSSSAEAGKPPKGMPQNLWNDCVAAGKKTGVDPYVLAAQSERESQFGKALAGSPSAGDGVMQVEPSTRAAYASKFEAKMGHPYNHSSQADQVAMAGVILASKGGSTTNMLQKYNGGDNWRPGATDSYGRVIKADEYAASVSSRAAQMKNGG